MKAGLPRLLFISIIFLSLVSCPTEGVPRAVQNVEVNRELYERTFNEILQFIKTMDEIIAAKDFVKWKEKCTPGYLA